MPTWQIALITAALGLPRAFEVLADTLERRAYARIWRDRWKSIAESAPPEDRLKVNQFFGQNFVRLVLGLRELAQSRNKRQYPHFLRLRRSPASDERSDRPGTDQ